MVLALPLRRLAAVLPHYTHTRNQRHLYAFFGMEDASIPPEQVDQIEAELEKYQVPIVFSLRWRPRFFCNHRASYNPEAAADAWEHVKQLGRFLFMNWYTT